MVVTISAELLPSAYISMFWFSRDVSGLGVGAFPPANEIMKVRFRMEKNVVTGHHSDQRKSWMRSSGEEQKI